MHFFDHFLDDLFSPLFRTIQNRTICSKFIIHATMSLQNDKNDKNDQNHLKLAKWLKTDQKLIKKSVIFGVFWVPKPQCQHSGQHVFWPKMGNFRVSSRQNRSKMTKIIIFLFLIFDNDGQKQKICNTKIKYIFERKKIKKMKKSEKKRKKTCFFSTSPTDTLTLRK